MKKRMGITLIIIGAIAILCGLFFIFDGNNGSSSAGANVADAGSSRPSSVPEATLNSPDEVPGEELAPAASSGHSMNPKEQQQNVPQASQNDSKLKGNDFEGYVADILKANGIRLLQWNQGSTSPEGAYAENELNPDFLLRHKDESLEYWLECKYRSSLPQQGFSLEDYQLSRYNLTQGKTKKKVLIALGVGGSAAEPRDFYVIPLDTLLRFKRIGYKYLPHYSVTTPRTNFRQHVSGWFHNDVFKRKKQ